jgi:hypothetical protein
MSASLCFGLLSVSKKQTYNSYYISKMVNAEAIIEARIDFSAIDLPRIQPCWVMQAPWNFPEAPLTFDPRELLPSAIKAC